jgi:hypothetical protein
VKNRVKVDDGNVTTIHYGCYFNPAGLGGNQRSYNENLEFRVDRTESTGSGVQLSVLAYSRFAQGSLWSSSLRSSDRAFFQLSPDIAELFIVPFANRFEMNWTRTNDSDYRKELERVHLKEAMFDADQRDDEELRRIETNPSEDFKSQMDYYKWN